MKRAPAHLHPYIDVLGEDLAVTFLLRFGGGYLNLGGGRGTLVNPAASLIGAERLAALKEHFGGRAERVPTGKDWIACKMREDGLSVTEIARRLHAADVTVRGWLKRPDHWAILGAPKGMRPGASHSQMDLFEG